MHKKIIRLTESDLHSIVKESVNNIITEHVHKQNIIRKLYRIVEPYTHSKYHDSGWGGIDKVIEALENAGFEVNVSVKDGGYRNSMGGNTLFSGRDDVSYWKEFNLEIPVEDKVINGVIRGNLCGTMEDPFSSYDITCTFF